MLFAYLLAQLLIEYFNPKGVETVEAPSDTDLDRFDALRPAL